MFDAWPFNMIVAKSLALVGLLVALSELHQYSQAAPRVDIVKLGNTVPPNFHREEGKRKPKQCGSANLLNW